MPKLRQYMRIKAGKRASIPNSIGLLLGIIGLLGILFFAYYQANGG